MSQVLRGVQVTEALDYLKNLNVVTRAEWDRLTNAQQNSAFTAAGVENKAALEALKKLVSDGLEQGWGSAQFEQAANELLAHFQTEAGSLRTFWNTVTAKAMAEGRKDMLRDPEVLRAVPYLLYDAFLDAATRANHRALDGAIAPANWDGWNFYAPPNGYNCRCNLISLTRVDGERRLAAGGRFFDITQGVPNQSSPRPGPDPGWTKFAEGQARQESAGMIRDLNAMIRLVTVEQIRYMTAIRGYLLEIARNAFARKTSPEYLALPDFLFRAHAQRLAPWFAATRVLGMARVLSEADLLHERKVAA